MGHTLLITKTDNQSSRFIRFYFGRSNMYAKYEELPVPERKQTCFFFCVLIAL